MIYFVENQSPLNQSDKNEYILCDPFIIACLIYKSLYHLPVNLLGEISNILFFVKNDKDERKFIVGLRRYKADYRHPSYKKYNCLTKEINRRFPSLDELSNLKKKLIIEQLINNANVVSSKTYKEPIEIFRDEKVIFYLPFCRDLSLEIIDMLKEDQVSIIPDKNTINYIGDVPFDIINKNNFIEISGKLNKIKKFIASQNYDVFLLQNYSHPDLMKCLPTEFKNSIERFIKGQKRRLHLFGDDDYIVNRTISKVLEGYRVVFYYMPKELNDIQFKERSIVVFNFEKLITHSDIYLLYNKTILFDQTLYIVLHTTYYTKPAFFNNYDSIEVPSFIKLHGVITSIFLAMLTDKNIYNDWYGVLKILSDHNILTDLIPEVKSLDHLFNIINKFQNISFEDLTSNVAFWYCVKVLANDLNKTVKELQHNKSMIRFKKDQDLWKIEGIPGISHMAYKTSTGLKYLLIIIKNSILNNRGIDSSTIRIINSYYSNSSIKPIVPIGLNKLRKKDYNDSDRSTISSAISYLKKHHPALKQFIEEHFSFSTYDNSFNHKNIIEVEIDDPYLKDNFFDFSA